MTRAFLQSGLFGQNKKRHDFWIRVTVIVIIGVIALALSAWNVFLAILASTIVVIIVWGLTAQPSIPLALHEAIDHGRSALNRSFTVLRQKPIRIIPLVPFP